MFSSHLRIEKQQRRRMDLELSAPSPQRKLASASSSHRTGVSCRKLGLKFNCMWCFDCQWHWRLHGGWHNIPQETEGPCSLSSPGKEATSDWSSFRSIMCGMVQRPQPLQMSLNCIQLSVLLAAWNKQCMLAAGKHQTSISWRNKSTWRSKTLMWGSYETYFGASWPKSDMPPKMDFDCIGNSKTFSHGNTVCKYQLFIKLLHIFIEIIPFKSCPIFYHTTLSPLLFFSLRKWHLIRHIGK